MNQPPAPSVSHRDRQCPECGAPIPADAPDGLCPKCLVVGATESRSDDSRAGSPVSPPSVAEVDALLADFEVHELLGQGGMGAVYKARQTSLNRTVAIKVLPAAIAGDPAFAERFAREAHALARLNHPNIVTVHDVGQAADLCYIVMEYVDGANLRLVLGSGKLSPREALAIVTQVCDALQFAHDCGVVHRDIKPENILLTESGTVKIADFGLVKLVGSREPLVTLTDANQTVGTPRYMAPEQLSGSSEADHRADIFSLGIVFYELLTGQVPGGRFDPPSKKVTLDVRLDEVVLRALDQEPDRRYQQAGEMKTEVNQISATSPQPVNPHEAPAAREGLTQSRPLRRVCHSGAFWIGFAALTGLATVFLPWAAALGRGILIFGHESGWMPLLVAGLCTCIFILNLVSAGRRPRPAWRAIGIAAGGLAIVILSTWYVIAVGQIAASAHSAAAPDIGAQIDQLINRSARADVGALLALTAGLLLLLFGVIELVDRRSR